LRIRRARSGEFGTNFRVIEGTMTAWSPSPSESSVGTEKYCMDMTPQGGILIEQKQGF
jgi:hypothetical protein